MNAAAPGDDACPRCGGHFHCGANDAAPCPCSTFRLDAATLAALRSRWQGCLCPGCLAALARGDSLVPVGRSFPPPPAPDPEAPGCRDPGAGPDRAPGRPR